MTEFSEEYSEQEKALNAKIEEWSRTFRHKKACRQYRLTRYCIHLAKAEQRRFGKESDILNSLPAFSRWRKRRRKRYNHVSEFKSRTAQNETN